MSSKQTRYNDDNVFIYRSNTTDPKLFKNNKSKYYLILCIKRSNQRKILYFTISDVKHITFDINTNAHRTKKTTNANLSSKGKIIQLIFLTNIWINFHAALGWYSQSSI